MKKLLQTTLILLAKCQNQVIIIYTGVVFS